VGGSGSSKVKKTRTVDAHLELKPRYPLLGGWKYAFVTGYDMPLSDVLRVNKGEKGEELVLGVPFVNAWKDLVYGDVEVVVILPEGAK
jgi:oligosaccharyltransferase complex subunit alpha (ribophorin I)